jgi:hypothetical protein
VILIGDCALSEGGKADGLVHCTIVWSAKTQKYFVFVVI